MQPKRLVAAGQKGGSGKSTLIACLAWEGLRRGQRVLIVDCDPQGSLRTWAADGRDHQRPMGFCPNQVADGGAAILALSGDACLNVGWVDEQGGEAAVPLRALEQSFRPELVLFDVPGRSENEVLPLVQQAAIADSDVALVPVSPSYWEVNALQESADALRACTTKAVVVMNSFAPGDTLAPRAAANVAAAGLPLLRTRIHWRHVYRSCLFEGRGPTRDAGREAAREIRALYDELNLGGTL